MNNTFTAIDGNEAVAHIAYKTNEICAIYPITPASPMGELADQWATERRPNIWGTVPLVVQLQSEGGAAGTVHGALQTGALTTTFTASQGLLLMIPNLYKIAGELTAAVIHVASRSLACQALSIFGDHSDVMAVRATGFAMLCSASVQEAHDLALVAQAATLVGRVPFIHFFDGFRTSHEINSTALLTDDQIRGMIDEDAVLEHRRRRLSPDHPFIRGTAQNPDVYFQARERVNPYYLALPGIVQQQMDRFAGICGRQYQLFDYHGDPEADRVIVMMGSGGETARETVDFLRARHERVGVLQCRLYRPFDGAALRQALPASCQGIAVLDRTKEPGATGEPLYQDVVTALAESPAGESRWDRLPRVVGGRYGLSSKEFTPAMVKTVFDELRQVAPKNHFTIGIHDDVTGTSLNYDRQLDMESDEVTRALFFGLGADGTVSANKNSIAIISEETDLYTQAYFVYDSKKSGSRTISHLRFGRRPIRAPYLIASAHFVGCHQFSFLTKFDVLRSARPGGVFLLNAPYGPEEIWRRLPARVREQIVTKNLTFYVIDAYGLAEAMGLGGRINTVMQTCFFAITGLLPRETALAKIKEAVHEAYGKKGGEIVRHNIAAIDAALSRLHLVTIPPAAPSDSEPSAAAHTLDAAPAFVRDVTALIMADRGDELPVSALPADGTFPSGTAAWEKRRVSAYAPVWEPETCVQCGHCGFVCPHSVIRVKIFDESHLTAAPESFKSAPLRGRGFPEQRYSLQVHVEDCTGCGLCVDVCPATSQERASRRAINMSPLEPLVETARNDLAFFAALPETERERVDFSTVRGVQYLEPLFEFSGACAGCGETPYLKLLTQLFGDRLVIANATGCSSIYGGNLPTTPWSVNHEGRGPAWSNSLFEDNAEFGYGFRLTIDKHGEYAKELLLRMRDELGGELVDAIVGASQTTEVEIRAQRQRITALMDRLGRISHEDAGRLRSVAEHLVRRSVWIVGGDGWAYDIGYGGLDHVLAAGRDVNVLVLDTEVYSNTGGQASKATPLAAVAKFAAGGKSTGKKDLALMAIAYGNVYVARIAMGANAQQTLQALREAEAYRGPSLIIAYSHCIAHGINMETGLRQQKRAVDSGYWPLFRYNPELAHSGRNPLELDSPRPRISLPEYAYNEMRYTMLKYSHPEDAKRLMGMAQDFVNQRWQLYERMAGEFAQPGARK